MPCPGTGSGEITTYESISSFRKSNSKSRCCMLSEDRSFFPENDLSSNCNKTMLRCATS
ncbi:unnamed protein product [Amoebophrya sp. A120]|nr:unnamed protein product [Amoebophrya sp. A120]|eukprot:GSA120T00005786001.1